MPRLRHKTLATFGIGALALALASLALQFFSGSIENKAATVFSSSGLDVQEIPHPQKNAHVLEYNDLKLDHDGFSTLKSLKIGKNFSISPLSDKKYEITLTGLTLNGESNGESGLAITGLNRGLFSPKDLLRNVSSLNISGAKLLILSEELGGVSVDIDLQIRRTGRKGQDSYSLSGHASSAQKNLVFNASISGNAGTDGKWRIALEFDRARIDIPGLKASRISGTITTTGKDSAIVDILGDINAGNLVLNETPWHSAAITIDSQDGNLNIFTDAKAAGTEDIELSLSYSHKDLGTKILGSVYTPALASLLGYISHNGIAAIDEDIIAALAHVGGITTDFVINKTDQDKEELKFRLKDDLDLIEISGKEIKNDTTLFTLEFESNALPLSNIYKFLSKLPPEEDTRKASGNAFLRGSINKTSQAIDGNVKIILEDGAYRDSSIDVTALNGAISIENLPGLSTVSPQDISCTDTLTGRPCRLSIALNRGTVEKILHDGE